MSLDTDGSKMYSPPLLRDGSVEKDLIPACHFRDEETEAQSAKATFLMWDGQLVADLKQTQAF